MRVFGISGGGGGGYAGRNDRRTISKRLSAELPDVAADEISRHETWFRQRGLFLAKKKIENEVRVQRCGFFLFRSDPFAFQLHLGAIHVIMCNVYGGVA